MKVPLSTVPSEISTDQFPRAAPFVVGKQRHTFPVIADPLLCVTPEKGDLKKSFERLKGDSDEKKSIIASGSQRVRFDHTVEVCELSPNNAQESKNTSMTGSIDFERKSYSYYVPDEDYLVSMETFKDDMVVSSEDQTIDKTFRSLGLSQPVDSVVSGQSVYAHPELNTLLKIGKGMKLLQETEPDPMQLAAGKLATSSKAKLQVEEKASLKLNIQNDMFRQLTSVDVNEDDVVHAMSKRATVPAKFSANNSSEQGRLEDGPDLLEFFSRDLQSEPVSLTLDALPNDDHTLQSAPLLGAFDVYRQLRAWHNL